MTHTPTPAEIETLRKIVNGELDREVDYAAIIAANNTLDRLSPAPEVDEATVWARKVFQAIYKLPDGDHGHEGGAPFNRVRAYLRQAIAELIASKDAEIATLSELRKVAARDAGAADRARFKAESELASKDGEIERLAGINSQLVAEHNAMNQDGARLESELAALRAENERLKDTLNTLGTRWALRKAAERNTAEPEHCLSGEPHRKAGEVVRSAGLHSSNGSGNTAPVVEVTQAGAKSAQIYADFHCEDGSFNVIVAERLAAEFDRVRTEAEARGRREALEGISEDTKQWVTRERVNSKNLISGTIKSGNMTLHYAAHAAFKALDELKRMMTGGK